ncbi:DUF218 domain-containing protein [Candidatus Woesearchaeota archaeon]|jgi:lysophospholipase L1-like esterase|nr:DUF218 domain-containing protein [Candidatus Woesearchaeota archaeon]MBT4335843.1 DUF218 domain-containing protein [Candidatus Woesearchaeota archaeon]MBT4469178.1 DUF218 domain-containing protein [Candidatus Woesearchaeota archaeon]MBT6744503.1 DUF218 domain-containing protein [Candidatus Woesearchaeota archaeon]
MFGDRKRGKGKLLFLLVVIFLFISWLSFSVLADSCNSNKIALLGDSITVGWGPQFIQSCGNQPINYAVSGKWTPWMLTKLKSEILNKGYTHLIVLGGTNDISGGKSAPDVIANLEQIYFLARNNNIKVIAGTIPPYNKQNSVEKNNVVKEINVWIRTQKEIGNIGGVVDFYQLLVSQEPCMNSNYASSCGNVHPNTAGYQAMSNKVFSEVFGGQITTEQATSTYLTNSANLQEFDTMMILGRHLRSEMENRVRAGYDLISVGNNFKKLILTGGCVETDKDATCQTCSGGCNEATEMETYLLTLDQNIHSKIAVIKETKSGDTAANLQNSKGYIQPGEKVLVVSDHRHVKAVAYCLRYAYNTDAYYYFAPKESVANFNPFSVELVAPIEGQVTENDHNGMIASCIKQQTNNQQGITPGSKLASNNQQFAQPYSQQQQQQFTTQEVPKGLPKRQEEIDEAWLKVSNFVASEGVNQVWDKTLTNIWSWQDIKKVYYTIQQIPIGSAPSYGTPFSLSNPGGPLPLSSTGSGSFAGLSGYKDTTYLPEVVEVSKQKGIDPCFGLVTVKQESSGQWWRVGNDANVGRCTVSARRRLLLDKSPACQNQYGPFSEASTSKLMNDCNAEANKHSSCVNLVENRRSLSSSERQQLRAQCIQAIQDPCIKGIFDTSTYSLNVPTSNPNLAKAHFCDNNGNKFDPNYRYGIGLGQLTSNFGATTIEQGGITYTLCDLFDPHKNIVAMVDELIKKGAKNAQTPEQIKEVFKRYVGGDRPERYVYFSKCKEASQSGYSTGPSAKNSGSTAPSQTTYVGQGQVKDPNCLILYGDTRNPTLKQKIALESIKKECANPSLFHVGDFVDDGGRKDHWKKFLNYERDLIKQGTLYAIVGNHESKSTYKGKGHQAIADNLGDEFPYIRNQMSNGGHHVVPITSNLIAIILNNEGNCNFETQFLKQQLNANPNKDIMLGYHKPAYPQITGSHSNGCARKWHELLVEHKNKGNKVLAFAGHTHGLARVIRGGVTHLEVGAMLNPRSCLPTQGSVFCLQTRGYYRCDANLHCVAKDENGNTLDQFNI